LAVTSLAYAKDMYEGKARHLQPTDPSMRKGFECSVARQTEHFLQCEQQHVFPRSKRHFHDQVLRADRVGFYTG
jgi:hypothetical protein